MISYRSNQERRLSSVSHQDRAGSDLPSGRRADDNKRPARNLQRLVQQARRIYPYLLLACFALALVANVTCRTALRRRLPTEREDAMQALNGSVLSDGSALNKIMPTVLLETIVDFLPRGLRVTGAAPHLFYKSLPCDADQADRDHPLVDLNGFYQSMAGDVVPDGLMRFGPDFWTGWNEGRPWYLKADEPSRGSYIYYSKCSGWLIYAADGRNIASNVTQTEYPNADAGDDPIPHGDFERGVYVIEDEDFTHEPFPITFTRE